MVYKDRNGNIHHNYSNERIYGEMCAYCGKRIGTEGHHLMAGRADRKKADKYGLIAMLCHTCHDNVHNHHIGYEELEELAERVWLKFIGTFKEWFNTFHINRCDEIKFNSKGDLI